jgi:hypothetical protein
MCFVVQMESVQQLPLVVVTQRDFRNIHGMYGGGGGGEVVLFSS